MRFVRATCAALVFGALAALPAEAFEIHLGYSILKDKTLNETLQPGFVAGLGFDLGKTAMFVAEVSGHEKTFSVLDGTTLPTDTKVSVLTAMGGFRFYGSGKSRLYVQVLGGAGRAKIRLLETGLDGLAQETAAAVQPGAGLDIGFSTNVVLRVGADYRIIFTQEQIKEWRFHGGIAVRF
jgi:hypothetical protein